MAAIHRCDSIEDRISGHAVLGWFVHVSDRIEKMNTREVLLLAGPRRLLGALEPWIAAKKAAFEVRCIEIDDTRGDRLLDGDSRLDGAVAFVWVVSPQRAPSVLLPGMGLTNSQGRWVMGSLLPLSFATAKRFCTAAISVEKRAGLRGRVGPVLLLGEWEARAAKMAQRSRRCLERSEVACFDWSAQRVGRGDLSYGLGCGAGVALYYGHGRSVGWAGYHGFRARHLPSEAEALGAMLSVTCSTASRGGSGLSFSERCVASGFAAASLGATRKTRHLSNAYLASSLCEAMAGGAIRLHEALIAARLPEDILRSSYRLFGDVSCSLEGASMAEVEARCLFAPDPEKRIGAKEGRRGEGVSAATVHADDVDLAELIGL